ncbi:hypothetical protein [Pseudomonas abietaniphila]|uniref:hypothetical protein n=1 Tax=Pseudomonas abietaniphila TaxID=89065 RepID=UPI00128DEB2A|nr:hypothetical protein [Pseudomonas abietaniphila]
MLTTQMNESGEIMAMLPWQIEILRFSFLNMSSGIQNQDFGWSSLTSSEPETVTEKRGLGVRTEEGPWLNGHLTVSKQHGRTDVIYSAGQQESPLPNAGSVNDIYEIFRTWYKRLGVIGAKRYGFGGVLLLPVESAAEGYTYLNRFLPFVMFESDMSDFFLQVNRKKQSDYGYRVNELSKWSTINIKTIQVSDDGVSEEPASIHALRLEFDINTAESSEAVDTTETAHVLEDLEARSLFVMANGAV